MEPELDPASNPIVIRSLTKRFDEFVALDSLDLTVESNSFLGFLGPNGAGKTTAIKIMTNLLRSSGGSAYLNGVDVTEHPKEALEGVGAVVETPEFYPYLTPRQTLRYLGRLRGVPKDRVAERTDELMAMVKLEEWKDKKIGKFSKGMKQRLAVAQALLHRPDVLILDEPTSGLDPRGMVEMRQILKELKKEHYTVFMSSHLLNEVQEVCDHVALIDRGKLLKSGKVDDLLRERGCRQVEVRFLRPPTDHEVEVISGLDGVTDVRVEGVGSITVLFKGFPEGLADLLDGIRATGARVSEFKEAGLSLESLYLRLIKESR